MTAINAVTDYALEGDIGVITLNSPPVNALSAAVRDGLAGGMDKAGADAGAKAMVLICEGRTFIAGADITEFGGAAEGRQPVRRAGRHRRLAQAGDRRHPRHRPRRRPGGGARLPLPRRRPLGPLRPAGGRRSACCRAPAAPSACRASSGAQKALEMVTSGQHVPAKACLDMGLVDEIVEEGKLREGALAFARKVVAEGRPLKKVRDLNDKVEAARGHPEIFADFRKANARKFRGFLAPEYNIRCIEAAVNQPFDEGLKTERTLFMELMTRPAERRPALRLLRRAPGGQDPRRAGRHAADPGQQRRHHRRRHHGRRHRHELRQRRHPGDHRRGRSRTRSTAA